MHLNNRVLAGALLLAGLQGVAGGRDGGPSSTPSADPPLAPPVSCWFEENRGQSEPAVRFLARSRGMTAFLTDRGAVFAATLPRGREGGGGSDGIHMEFAGAAPGALRAEGPPLPGVSHYILGKDPAGWREGVPHHRSLLQRGLWPGVSVRWRLTGRGTLAYDLLLAPGADPGKIGLRFRGAKSVSVDAAGNLRLDTGRGEFLQTAPLLYQSGPGGRRRVEGGFAAAPDGRVGFRAGSRDPSLPLVIDPEVTYATYLGGTDWETGGGPVALGSGGEMFLAGETNSTDFPVNGPYQTNQPSVDLFLSKFNAAGSSLIYSTYLGGMSGDNYGGLALDSEDAPVLTGATTSSDFPTMDPLQANLASVTQDAFVTKLSVAGNSLQWSTFLGGNDFDSGHRVALDGDDAVYLLGRTRSTNFPLKSAIQGTHGGATDLFVSKFAADGSTLAYSTYIGGSGEEFPGGLAVDAAGAACLSASTLSTDFPTQDALQQGRAGSYDGCVLKIAPSGTALDFSTYLGGNDTDDLKAIALDSEGNIWVLGTTESTDYPTVVPYQESLAGTQRDLVLTKIRGDGGQFLASTYYGGTATESAFSLAVNFNDEPVLAGATASANIPVVDPLRPALAGAYDGFVARFSREGTDLGFATWWGGAGDDYFFGLALDGADAVLGGNTTSTNFPVVDPLQGSLSGTSGQDAVLVRMDVGQGPPSAPGNVLAQLYSLTSVEVTWVDAGDTETGFRVERSTDGGPFATAGVPAANAVSFRDNGRAPDTDYTYRVFAFNARGDSLPSNESSVTTPPAPTFAPAAPTGLLATPDTPYRVSLTWTDASVNEDFFIVARSENGTSFDTLATPKLGSTTWTDTSPLPDRTYIYSVRAQNPVGSSLPSNQASATLPGTLNVVLEKGVLKDGATGGKDSINVTVGLTLADGAETETLDPVSAGLRLRLAGWNGASLLSIPAGDPGWKVKKKSSQWKSPKGSSVKARVKWTPATGQVLISVGGLNFAPAPVNPLRLTFGSGEEGGSTTEEWVVGKKSWKFVR